MTAPFLHVDLDAFYASVEQVLHPGLRGRPVLVGGGVVLAASYEARRFGVDAPMPLRRALELCPIALVVPGDFHRYLEFSRQVFTICERYTPKIEQISVDEAFLDVAGAGWLFGDAATIAERLREEVRAETGLALSVGVASTKFLAKVASRQTKPDGMVVVPPGGELEFLHPLSVRAIWGVGPVLGTRLAQRGILTVGDLAAVPKEVLVGWMGKAGGGHLHALAWNRDPRPVVLQRRAGSVGAQSALGRGRRDPTELALVLLRLSERVATRLRAKGRAGRTITVRVRLPDMSSLTRSTTLPAAVASTAALHRTGLVLLDAARRDHPGIVTLVAISVSHLEDAAPTQLELAVEGDDPARAGSPSGVAHLAADEAIDRVRAKYGKTAVTRASLLDDGGGVPDGFRELAERD